MTLDRDRPEILQPPQHPQACCTQQTITVPPGINAKTAQKHDYPSKAHRRSYTRRTGAERGFATAKDPATNDISRGWCRLMGLAPLMIAVTCLLVVRNQRILTAWDSRQKENQRRAAAGLRPEPANGAARPSPRSPPGRPDTAPGTTAPEHPQHTHHDSGSMPGNPAACTGSHHTNAKRTQHGGICNQAVARQNVRPRREHRPHSNVKTSGWS